MTSSLLLESSFAPRQPAPLRSLTRSPLVLTLLGATLLSVGWPPHPAPFPLLLLTGFVPYLRLEQLLTTRKAPARLIWGYTYLLLGLWHLGTAWWLLRGMPVRGAMALLLNTALLCLPLAAFRQTKARWGPAVGYLALPVYWLAFEQFHLHWALSTPWLTLGNGLATVPAWAQWYEYTGTLGGSAWIWAVNLALFWLLFAPGRVPTGRKQWPTAAMLGLTLGGPPALSYWLGSRYEEKGPAVEVLVVQPNIDPLREKSPDTPNFIPYPAQLRRLLRLTRDSLTSRTQLVLWPETARELPELEAGYDQLPEVRLVRQTLLAPHPGLSLLLGQVTIGQYQMPAVASPTAQFREAYGYSDFFNSAVYLDGPTAPARFYHKSRQVPGVEYVPAGLLSLLRILHVGGITASYGTQAAPTIFAPPAAALRPAPIICYESVYGDYVAAYVRQGATLLSVITNDGWWGDSPGHAQHLSYEALRAIETRRALARSANTGVSAFINQRGETIRRTRWWTATAARATVRLNSDLTFYVRHGELIGPAAQVLAGLGLLALGGQALRLRLRRRSRAIAGRRKSPGAGAAAAVPG